MPEPSNAAMAGFDPLIREWFEARFASVTEPQRGGWPAIRSGHDVLLAAPTGSGKTLAAFLQCLDGLVRRARTGRLPDATEVVYVSPLKALSSDVHKNLEAPLEEIGRLAREGGTPLAEIRTALRTGDTPARERRRMGRRRPHILVTTPESLYILMTAEKSRAMLAGVRTVIVDEIHAVAGDKRGTHLALTLARLEDWVLRHGGPRPQRIGLSATVNPIGEVAAFLSTGRARIVNVGYRREMDLAVEVPRDELAPVATMEMWDETCDRLATLIGAHRSTLVFVNTRRLAERVAHQLGERLGPGSVLPHHGSLARHLRLEAEDRLKRGDLRAVVATASLELGIDIGSVDLVCQIGSPRSVSVALQRVGRSGHWVGAKPKGRLFATTRDDLIECAALAAAMRSGELDRLSIPQNALDILAQQLVAECAAGERTAGELFALARTAWPYRALPRESFDAVVDILTRGITTERGRSTAWLHHDRVHGRLRARRGARLAAITCGGAIPDTSNYVVVAEPDGAVVGTVDEDFAVESMTGDVFLLGTHSWRIRRIEAGRLRVEDARGAAPDIPFWRGEAPGRTARLSEAVARLREEIAARPDVEWLEAACGLDRRGAEQAVEYVLAGRAALGAVPAIRRVVAERFFDEAGGMQLILHAPFGARLNRAWGLALRQHFRRVLQYDLQAAATDNGIAISFGERRSFPLETVFEVVGPSNVEGLLTEAVLEAPMFTARWRWNATRALAVPRYRGGSRVPAPIQRMRAEELRAAVPPDHPLVTETLANCLHEAMDLDGLRAVLSGIQDGSVATSAIDTPAPSPFAHEILNANPYAFLDDAPLAERRARAVVLRRALRTDFTSGAGALDPQAIAQVAAEAWPPMRDAEEFHDALLTLVALPAGDYPHFAELAAARRAFTLRAGGRAFYVAAECLHLAARVWLVEPGEGAVPAAYPLPQSREGCAAEVLRGWFESTCPLTSEGLAATLALPRELIEAALEQLEAEGQILRGNFTGTPGAAEWCHRRLLERIHRLTIGRLRREIEPVTTSEFRCYLARWQHAAAGTLLHGADGTLEIIRQLQGLELPAAAWEAEVLPRRVARYRPEFLDQLCLAGEVMWGRLSPHPAFGSGQPHGRRVRPTRAAPLSLFLREDSPWLLAGERPVLDGSLSHPAREVLAALEARGASFFADLTLATRRLPTEVEDALWELVAAGLVTADGFENLRALLDPKRRRGEGRGRRARPRHAAGRWALLLRTGAPPDSLERAARQLLARWGVVFRDILARECSVLPWRDLLVVLRRMETRGEIRGGRFVSAFPGEQFALPEALDLLRAVRRAGVSELPSLAPADPLSGRPFDAPTARPAS